MNVKRLRPRELGPFDYQAPARTASLWVAEGLTCYYTDLLLCRAGVWAPAQLLAGLCGVIEQLQRSPGRLVQTLEESSLAVWENSFSGLQTGDDAVSYYTKGHVVGFLLDMQIRRATGGARSLDDLMRLAYARHSGAEGFTPEDLDRAVAEIAGAEVAAWVRRAVATTEELGYDEALAWLGLALAGPGGDQPWELRVADPDDTTAATRRAAWWG
jgi:predicted metalloprotease with PDZ domain